MRDMTEPKEEHCKRGSASINPGVLTNRGSTYVTVKDQYRHKSFRVLKSLISMDHQKHGSFISFNYINLVKLQNNFFNDFSKMETQYSDIDFAFSHSLDVYPQVVE